MTDVGAGLQSGAHVRGAEVPRLRPSGLFGPLILGAAVWCAAGTITVASPDLVSPRLAIPAAWWVFPIAVAAAWLVPAWRRGPLTSLPAVLATLPWWPVPLPAVALIWTGPLAWLPIAAAVCCAVGGAPLTFVRRVSGAHEPRRAIVIAGAATFLLGAIAAWSVDSHVPGGDEPHYLVITQSLLRDQDLRIENNHQRRDYEAYFPGTIAPHYIARGRDGQIYSIHAPGLPALVSPAFAIAGYRGVEVFLLILAALTGALVWLTGWRVTNDAPAAWFAWAAVVGSASFLLHSFAVFPDVPGALSVAMAVLLLVGLVQTPLQIGAARLVAASAALALLPWYHTRFSVLAGGFGLLIAAVLLRDTTRPAGARRARAALFLALPALSAAAWLGLFQWIYGVPNPAAPYGGAAGTRAAYIPGGLAGLLFDEQFGLLIYAPVFALVTVGKYRITPPPMGRLVRLTVAIAGTYLAAVATYWMWWAGNPALPARFVVAALPIAAIPLAAAWQAGDAIRRRLYLTLLAISIAVTTALVTVHRGDLAWNTRTGEAVWLDWLSPVANLPRGWPNFFWKLDPEKLGTEVPFAIHAAVWVAIFSVGWIILQRIGRSRTWRTETWRAAIAFWLIGGLTLAIQIGWALNRSTGLDPSRSQMALLSAGARVWEIAPLHVRSLSTLNGAIRIRGEEQGRLDGPAPWLLQKMVPAGTYTLHISTGRPRSGQLAVYVGHTAQPFRVIPIRAANRQEATLTLPAGAIGLTIVPDRSLETPSGVVELEPLRLDSEPRFARLATTYGAASVYFLDDNAFVEPDGFWVRGERSTDLVIEPRAPGHSAMAITLHNGGAPNTVELRADGVVRRETFGVFETRTVGLPVRSTGAIHLGITSASGFRPSGTPGNTDSRYLGVRITIGS